MVREHFLEINTVDATTLVPGVELTPFQVSVRWVGGGDRDQLSHEVTLCGVKEPSNFLTVTAPSPCTGIASNESGRDTPQFKAVLDLRSDMIRLMQVTPLMTETISSLFKEKKWIDFIAECSAACLLDCALEKIRQDPTQFLTLIGMLRKTVGMQDIVEKLISSCA
jgi:hypothetical protein